MKYIRTFSGIIVDTEQQAKRLGMSVEEYESKFPYSYSAKADTIEELCDEFVGIRKSDGKPYLIKKVENVFVVELGGWVGRLTNYETIYGAIWTDKGLIYVAKMNEKGELELL